MDNLGLDIDLFVCYTLSRMIKIQIKKLGNGLYELQIANQPVKIVDEHTIKQIRRIYTHGQIVKDY